MRRSDVGPWIVVVVGGLLSVPLWRALDPGGPSPRPYLPTETTATAIACAAPFELHSNPGEWAVVGRYRGTAALGPKGLAIDVTDGTVQADRAADVRGIVFGLAQASESGAWSVTHTSDPIPLGHLDPGIVRSVGPARPFIPGVRPEDLANGWLVVEHVLEAPEQPGGTAWTYVHADRSVLEPLLIRACAGPF